MHARIYLAFDRHIHLMIQTQPPLFTSPISLFNPFSYPFFLFLKPILFYIYLLILSSRIFNGKEDMFGNSCISPYNSS